MLLWGQSLPVLAAEAPQLGQPVDCSIGKTCFIQAYVDSDPRPFAARDHRCGTATFDGHTGTDFRLLNTAAAGVAVLAAAAGTVTAASDGMADQIVRPLRPAMISGAACGNSVSIEHGAGWQTQYCHLRQGSVRVKAGDLVTGGAPVGAVGYSGNAWFAHLHFIVRRDGGIVDPFTGRPPDGTCAATTGPLAGPKISLWDTAADRSLAYTGGQILETGFADAPVAAAMLERGSQSVAPPRGQSAELFVFARIANMRAGDRVRFVLTGPENLSLESLTEPVARDQGHYVATAMQRRRGWSWRLGPYRARAMLLRGDQIVSTSGALLEMK